jgi:protein ImuB
MLFGCIHVSDFPVQAALRDEAAGSFESALVAVLDGPQSLLKVFACNGPAQRAGIRIGMTKLQAEACAGVVLKKRTLEQEESAQTALLGCAYSFSPRVESTCSGTVIVDLTGTDRLLGSSQEMGQQLAIRAQACGFIVTVGIAANADAALHAARGFSGITVIAPGEEALRLGCLPVEVLQPSPEILDTLDSWGIRDFKSLAALPPIPLTQRLGQAGLHLQQFARGEVQRELVLAEPPVAFQENIELEEAVDVLEPLGFIINRLLEDVASRLKAKSLATDQVQVDLGLEVHLDRQLKLESSPDSSAITTATLHQRTLKLPVPTQDAKVLLKLLQLDLAAHPPPAPVKKIAFEVFPARIRLTQTGLFQPLAPEPAKLEISLARLRATVGEKDQEGRERVGFPVVTDSHQPDSFQVMPSSAGPKELRECLPSPSLVLRWFRPPYMARIELSNAVPAAVVFNGVRAKVIHACGPWHSSGTWWDKSGQWQREEWDVDLGLNGVSRLYRIFRDLESRQWFVEGMYD